jgi:hypothetical protein
LVFLSRSKLIVFTPFTTLVRQGGMDRTNPQPRLLANICTLPPSVASRLGIRGKPKT